MFLLSASIVIGISGSFLTKSEMILASIATLPFSMISPSRVVSIPRSKSLPVNLIQLDSASMRIHSRMFIVVLTVTAF